MEAAGSGAGLLSVTRYSLLHTSNECISISLYLYLFISHIFIHPHCATSVCTYMYIIAFSSGMRRSVAVLPVVVTLVHSSCVYTYMCISVSYNYYIHIFPDCIYIVFMYCNLNVYNHNIV